MNPKERASALEDVVLAALNVAPDELEIRRLGQAYRQLSEALLKATQEPGRTTGSLGTRTDSSALDAIWGLIYGARSFHVLSRILSAYAQGYNSAVDIGGGWGPAGLWCALQGMSVRVVEVDRARRDLGRRVFEASGVTCQWTPRTASHEDLAGSDVVLFSFSLREMVPDVSTALAWIRAALSSSRPARRVVVVEGGSRVSSDFVMALRDEAIRDGLPVIAPCRAVGPCPLRSDDQWCHFTWRTGLGEVGQRIADSARRKGYEVHFSWLVFGEAMPGPVEGDRVIDLRPLGKQGTRVSLCTDDGLRTVDIDRRLARQVPELNRDVPGAMVSATSGKKRITSADDLIWHRLL